MVNKDSQCPICFKESGEIHWDVLLCSGCKNELAHIRNNVIAINEFNDKSKRMINEVFCISNRLNSGEQVSSDAGKQDNKDSSLMPSLQSIKALTAQLNKLDILRLKIRNDSIARKKTVINSKIDALSKSVAILQTQMNEKQVGVLQKESQILDSYQQSTKNLDSRYDEMKYDSVIQVQIQEIKLQREKFSILKELAFTTSNDNLVFFGLQILKIEKFLNYNILVINQFLENLIKFQKHLARVFNVKIPFLEDLINLLPNSAFYDLIKEKEFSMMGKPDDSDEDERKTPVENNNVSDTTSTAASSAGNVNIKGSPFLYDTTEKIIKLGDTIKLPLSSKTINNQRRASLGKSHDVIKEIPVVKERSLSPTRSSNNNKKLVIIPHKILNKPFNKLYIKEFLKFLLVMVKIYANFKYFLAVVDGTSTNSNDNTNAGTDIFSTSEINTEESAIDTYDFEYILTRIFHSDIYFSQQLSQLNTKRALLGTISSEDKVEAMTSTGARSVSFDLKSSMQTVYNLIIDGCARRPSTSSNEPVNTNAPTLLRDLDLQDLISKQTKFQLEDWDVVSQIY